MKSVKLGGLYFSILGFYIRIWKVKNQWKIGYEYGTRTSGRYGFIPKNEALNEIQKKTSSN